MTEVKQTWRCYFSEAAEAATRGTETEALVALGRKPVAVRAANQAEARAEFINQLCPGAPKATFVSAKTDPDSLQPYIICETVSG